MSAFTPLFGSKKSPFGATSMATPFGAVEPQSSNTEVTKFDAQGNLLPASAWTTPPTVTPDLTKDLGFWAGAATGAVNQMNGLVGGATGSPPTPSYPITPGYPIPPSSGMSIGAPGATSPAPFSTMTPAAAPARLTAPVTSGASGPTGGTTSAAPNPLLAGPGAYEQWIKANQGSLNTPTNVEDLFNGGAANALGTPGPLEGMSPYQDNTGYQNFATGLAGGMTGPTNSTQLLNSGALGGLTQRTAGLGSVGPGVFQQQAPGIAQDLFGPGATQNLYNSGIQNSLAGQSRSEGLGALGAGVYQNWAPTATGQFNAPGQREQVNQMVQGNLLGPTATGSTIGGGSVGNIDASRGLYGASIAPGQLGGPGALEKRYSQGNALENKGNSELFYQLFGLDPMQKSDTENLYDSGVGHLNPNYDYAEKRAIDTAQRSSAARGGFNSGLAAQQESDIGSSIRGQQALEQDRLAPQADAAKLARYNQGMGFANATDTETQNRLKDVFGIAGDTQAAENARFNTLGGLARNADLGTTSQGQLSIDQARALSESAARADASRFTGIQTALGAAAGADAGQIGRATTQAGILQPAEQLAQSQAQENRLTAGQADSAENQRLNSLFGISQGTDAASLARTQAGAGILQGSEQLGLQDSAQNLQRAQATDAASVDRINAMFGATNSTDRGQLDQTLGANTIAQGAATFGLNQNQQNVNTATAQQQATNARIQAQFQAADSADRAQLNRVLTQGGLMKDLQATGQDRLVTALGKTTALDSAEAKLVTDFYTDFSSVDATDSASLAALASKYGVSVEEVQSIVSTLGTATGLGIKAAAL